MATKQEVFNSINWAKVMAADRYAGGHREVMEAMFEGAAEIVDHWTDSDYQGSLAIAWKFPDGSVAVLTDSFGSCSGCDSWEDATDVEAMSMIQSLASSARVFNSVAEAADWCRNVNEDACDYTMRAAENLKFPTETA